MHFAYLSAASDDIMYNFYLTSAWTGEVQHFVVQQIASCASDVWHLQKMSTSVSTLPLARLFILSKKLSKHSRSYLDYSTWREESCASFCIDVRSPNRSNFSFCLLDDDMTNLNLKESTWFLTLCVLWRPGDMLNNAYTSSDPLAQLALYRRSDVREYLMGGIS
jgi:hypothetical protein